MLFRNLHSRTVQCSFFVALCIFLCVADVKTADRSLCHSCKPVSNRCSQIPDKAAQLKACLDTEFQETKLLIDNLDVCEQSITVSGPMTITAPGVYCLIADIDTGSLVIDADNVVLDLNNHTITSNAASQKVIEVLPGHAHITIKNGVVRVADGGTGEVEVNLTIGLLIHNGTNVSVQNVSFEGTADSVGLPEFMVGARLNSTRGIFMDRCSYVGMSFSALEFEGCDTGKISCCTAHDNTLRGLVGVVNVFRNVLSISNSSNLMFDQVHVDNNTGLNPTPPPGPPFGGIFFRPIFISNAQNCSFLHCSSNSNNSTGINAVTFAFAFDQASDGVCFDCEVNANDSVIATGGFILLGDDNKKILFDSCRALNNVAAGGSGAVGFVIEGGEQGHCIKNCVAKGNAGPGINAFLSANSYILNNILIDNMIGLATSSTNVVFGNYAEGNGTNYFAVLPVTTFTISTGTFASTPTAWDNISAVS